MLLSKPHTRISYILLFTEIYLFQPQSLSLSRTDCKDNQQNSHLNRVHYVYKTDN